MTWVVIISGAWLTVATAAALLIAGAIRVADARQYEPPAPVPSPPAACPTPGRPATTDGGDTGHAPVRRATAAPPIPKPRPGDHDRRRTSRPRVRLTPVRDPLNAAERVPPTHFGTP
jgi:hypothetical protein